MKFKPLAVIALKIAFCLVIIELLVRPYVFGEPAQWFRAWELWVWSALVLLIVWSTDETPAP